MCLAVPALVVEKIVFIAVGFETTVPTTPWHNSAKGQRLS